MALELYDSANFNGSIGNTNSQTLTVNTQAAENVQIILDDTSGGAPPSYDITVEFYSTAEGRWMQVDSSTGLTARAPSVNTSPYAQQYRITVTNSSGSSASYGISLESFKEI